MMENIIPVFKTLFILFFHFHSSFCFNDFSGDKFVERTKSVRKIRQNFQQNFISEAESLELPGISLQRSDQIMSAEYMFNFLNKLETGDDVRKASGMLDSEGELENADTVRSFSSKGKLLRRKAEVYKFNINSLSIEEKIKRVEIRLRHNEEVKNRKTRVKYVIKQNDEQILKYQSKEHFNTDGTYMVVDVTKTIKPVLNQLHGNVTIHVSMKQTKNKKSSRSVHSVNSSSKNNSTTESDALLIIYSEDQGFMKKMYEHFLKTDPSEQLSRSKRAIKIKKKKRKMKGKRKRKICQLEDFDVDFNHLGWGQWVVFPKVFNARICTGVCPSPVAENFSPTNHAMLQSLMRLGQPKAVPMPCCVPTRLRPLKLLYYEKDEIVVRHHENMVAASCGCR